MSTSESFSTSFHENFQVRLVVTDGDETVEMSNTLFVYVCTNCGGNKTNPTGEGAAARERPIEISSIFPVPVDDIVTVSGNAASHDVLAIEIVDLLGRRVWGDRVNVTAGSFEKQLDVASLSRGMYFIRFDSHNKLEIRSLVVR